MKLNNKGFAISSIMYLILVLAIVLISIILTTLFNRRIVLDKMKNKIILEIEGEPLSQLTYVFDSGDVGSYTFEVPETGLYKVELWGAQGGGTYGGKGAYTSGIVELNKGKTLYIYIGGKGDAFNGGGSSPAGTSRAGGGATDIRLTDGNWNNFSSLKSRIMVAAGGGSVSNEDGGAKAGIGGKLTGIDGVHHSATAITYKGYGGTQTSGGLGATDSNQTGATSGSFGVGGAGGTFNSDGHAGSGGGGGYYGGGGSSWHTGSGGGSSYISGYVGCNSISEASTSSSITHTNSPVHYSDIIFSNPVMISGDTLMTQPNGTTSIGHSGNGYARITFISYSFDDTKSRTYIYNYTGGEEVFNTKNSGYYKIETWGAQGGTVNDTYYGGYGGYSTGIIYLNKNDKLYVNVGQEGSVAFNAGDGLHNIGQGGGASYIATESGNLSSFSSKLNSLLLVSGGGGASYYHTNGYGGSGGSGGGFEGGSGQSINASNTGGEGGTQSSGGAGVSSGSFGTGGKSANSGGDGYFGGGANNAGVGGYGIAGAGGGSGYIGNTTLNSRYMYCYNCNTSMLPLTSTATGTCAETQAKSDCAKKGDGAAKITYLKLGNIYTNPSSNVSNDSSGICYRAKIDPDNNKTIYEGSLPHTYEGLDASKSSVTCTGIVLDWDKDIIIDALFETADLGTKRYSIVSSFDYINLQTDYSNKEIFIEVDAYGRLSVFFGGRTNDSTNNITYRNRYTSTSSITSSTAGTYRVIFYWNSSTKSFTGKLISGSQIVLLEGNDNFLSNWGGKSQNPILIGAGDYRKTKYYNTITIDSMTIYN